MYLFQNWSLLQRSPDTCLAALRKFAWQNFGLEVEVRRIMVSESSLWCVVLYLELMETASRLLKPLYAESRFLSRLCAAC